MNRRILVATVLLLVVFGPARAQTDTILNRYKQYLLNNTEPEGDVKQLRVSLNEQYQWDDINYKDTERANWQLLNHLKRVRDLALVWTAPKSPYYHQEAVWATINGALNLWLEKQYKNSNWWHNEIGVPQYMRDIIILLKEKLTPEQFNKAMKVFAQHRVQENGVGANLTWSADLGFHYGLLTNNAVLMRKCLDLILKEIKITTGDGVQPDFSFHQHGSRLQMYQYGSAFLWNNVRLAWELRGTKLAFPKEKINILTDFVLKGWQWQARGIATVPGTMDRSVSRKDALQSADIRKLVPYLMELSPGKAARFKAVSDRQNGKGSLRGYRYYPYSDFSAYQQKDFSFFLKTISSRTLASESINSENLKGHLLNSGDAYLIQNGKEYFNLMPVWNWEYLPGITAFKGADKINSQAFTGSVSDGKQGLTVMDYQLEDKAHKKSFSAHKFWASHRNLTLCLIAGMKRQNTGAVYTALDQCRRQGKVTVNSASNIVKEGTQVLAKVQWIHHAGFAYLPLEPATIELHLNTVTGTWKSINASASAEPVTAEVFMPVMFLEGQSTGYVLASCQTSKEAGKLAKKPVWKILRNDAACQAVRFKDGTIMSAFFSASVLKTAAHRLTVDQPCLLLITAGKMYVSDPSHSGNTVNVKLDKKVMNVKLSEDGSTKEILTFKSDKNE